MTDLADLLGVNSSTATRHCDRLQRRGLVQRAPATDDRRAVQVSLTPAGKRQVRRITEARRREISQILNAMTARNRTGLLDALRDFARAAGEVPNQHWALGWGTEPALGAGLGHRTADS